ncbi:MAG: ubiquinol-cytochrome C chaperone family protein [Alphaproteobacteria bacterium]
MAHVRAPAFYENMQVPDNFTGRFDLLLVHLFLIIRRGLGNRAFNQTLFDTMFADMDQTLREQGVGDMGVPKHMKRMMKAFNGRMHAYQDSFEDADSFRDILRRNLYGTVPDVSGEALNAMMSYLKKTDCALQAKDPQEIAAGDIPLPKPGGGS